MLTRRRFARDVQGAGGAIAGESLAGARIALRRRRIARPDLGHGHHRATTMAAVVPSAAAAGSRPC